MTTHIHVILQQLDKLWCNTISDTTFERRLKAMYRKVDFDTKGLIDGLISAFSYLYWRKNYKKYILVPEAFEVFEMTYTDVCDPNGIDAGLAQRQLIAMLMATENKREREYIKALMIWIESRVDKYGE